MEGKLIKIKDNYQLYRLNRLSGPELVEGKLSLKNCKAVENGYDLDELAKLSYECDPYIAEYLEQEFKRGFQKAVEILGDKKFSEQDMYKMFIYGRSIDTAKKHLKELEDKPIDEFFNDFIQSLQQTEWDVEIVMECGEVKQCECSSNENCLDSKPKLDEDGCLILKRK